MRQKQRRQRTARLGCSKDTWRVLLWCVLLVGCGGPPVQGVPPSTQAMIATPTPMAPVQLPGWHLQWDDEFSGDTLDLSHWAVAQTAADLNLGCCLHFGTQAWSPDNVSIHGGMLHIVTKQTSVGDYHYTSGALSTENTYAFLYGRIDVRAQLPRSTSLWPAFWLIPADSVGQPVAAYEIDFAEAWGSDPHTVYAFFHQGYGQTYCQDQGPDFTSGFHIFSLVWGATELEWLVDGTVQCTMQTNVPDIPLALILDTAIGGSHEPIDQSTSLPQTTEVDYVRIWSKL